MKCETIRERLHAYRAGEVWPSLREQLDEHLEKCESCRAELWLQAELENAGRQEPEPLTDERKRELLRGVHEQIAAEALPPKPEPAPRSFSWLKAGAPTLAFAGAAAALALVLTSTLSPGYETADGWLTASTGVEAFAPAPASLRFELEETTPVFHLEERAVLFRFTRFDGLGPLTIHTPDATVIVRGTIFFVDATEEGTVVGVERGRIEVRSGDGTVRMVEAGEQARTRGEGVDAEESGSPHFATLRSLFPPALHPEPEPEVPEPVVSTPVKTWAPPDPAIIRAVVGRRMPLFRECYERELKHDAELGGRIEVEIVYGIGGKVERARVVRDTVGSEPVASCVLARARALVFPEPERAPVVVQVPFVFTLGVVKSG